MRALAPVALLVVAVVAAAAGAGAAVPTLEAWASLGHRPLVGVSSAGFHGPLLTRVRAGTFRIRVQAWSDEPFHLVGPGVDRRTVVDYSGEHPVSVVWTVRLRHGTYRYAAEGVPARELRRAGVPVSGSFAVR